MRTRIFLIVGAVLLMLSVQPAAAAPAEPYQTTDACRSVFTITICVNGHGVVQENDSASGVTKVTINGTYTETLSRNGDLLRTTEGKTHQTLIFKDGEPQVAHTRDSRTIQITGREACTYDLNVIYANGEVRHEINNVDCG
ncbi:MAG: hypothetical protein M3457_15915 [Chloroflexota bacterium]|nr:hypothetical protein [Chloroflexota bacterium]